MQQNHLPKHSEVDAVMMSVLDAREVRIRTVFDTAMARDSRDWRLQVAEMDSRAMLLDRPIHFNNYR